MLFISRDTCSDTIAKLFRTCFYRVSHTFRAICCKMGYRTDVLCETKYQWGVSHHVGGGANLPEKVSHDMGYRSDSIAISRDTGLLSPFSDLMKCTLHSKIIFSVCNLE